MRRLAPFVLLALLGGCPDSKTKTPEPPPPTEKEPDPAALAAAAAQNFWNGVAQGSQARYRVVTVSPLGESVTTVVETLRAKTPKDYTLTTETIEGGNRIPGTDATHSWIPDPNVPKGVEVGGEDVRVGDESLRCKHTRLEDPGGTTDLWTYKSNLTVKLVKKGPNSTYEKTLEKLVSK